MAKTEGQILGEEIKKGMQGLNTNASPKKNKTCLTLTLIPLVALILSIILILASMESVSYITLSVALITSGFCSFYVRKIKRGILYTVTLGICGIGLVIDLFSILLKKYTDNLGYYVMY